MSLTKQQMMFIEWPIPPILSLEAKLGEGSLEGVAPEIIIDAEQKAIDRRNILATRRRTKPDMFSSRASNASGKKEEYDEFKTLNHFL